MALAGSASCASWRAPNPATGCPPPNPRRHCDRARWRSGRPSPARAGCSRCFQSVPIVGRRELHCRREQQFVEARGMSTRVDSDARQTHIDIHQDRQLVPSPSPVGCVSRCFDAVREQALNAIFTDRCFGKFEIETARKLGGSYLYKKHSVWSESRGIPRDPQSCVRTDTALTCL